MTSRMSPAATFVAWTSESSLFEEASDTRSFVVSIEDRALVMHFPKSLLVIRPGYDLIYHIKRM